jgi:hypothetical protein
VVQALVVSRFHWTIDQILNTDESWMDDVLTYAACEGIIRADDYRKKALAAK